ncbi:hypothetical protein D3C87_1499660 [compost metagenome]
MQTPVKNAPDETEAAASPTADERIDAIVRFLQQLVLLLEVEPDLNRESIAAWLEIVGRSERGHGLQTPRQQVAMDHLCASVLSPHVALERRTLPA